MDIIKAVQLYLDKIVAECGPGMKVLLMDKETVSEKTFSINIYRTICYAFNFLFSSHLFRQVLSRWCLASQR